VRRRGPALDARALESCKHDLLEAAHFGDRGRGIATFEIDADGADAEIA